MLGGLVKEVTADAGTSFRFYNARRLGIASWDARDVLTSYRYDALGRRLTEETADGLTRSYDYGPRGHVAEVTAEADDGTLSSTTIATAMSYSALGERAAITFGNDVRGHYNWNRRTRRLDGYEVTKTDDTRTYAKCTTAMTLSAISPAGSTRCRSRARAGEFFRGA